MKDIRDIRPYSVALIAHSLGGLVCMRYIIDCLQAGKDRPPITGLLMYGTPASGSDLVKVAKLVGFGIGLKIPILGSVANFLLRTQRQVADLATGSEFLTGLHAQWALRVVNGGHEDAEPGRMCLLVSVVTGEDDIVVTEASGKGMYGAISWSPLRYGHIDLVEPECLNDGRYIHAKNFLRTCRAAKKPSVLDRIWKASQDTWKWRTGRLIENVYYQAFLYWLTKGRVNKYFQRCHITCEFDWILKDEQPLFGVSLGASAAQEVWNRSPQPMYVHQLGSQVLFNVDQRAIDALFSGSNESAWTSIFPRVLLQVDGQDLITGKLLAQSDRHPSWLLRQYSLPEVLKKKMGRKSRMRIDFESILPLSISVSYFAAPWLVDKVTVRIRVHGDFRYFIAQQRVFPMCQIRPVVHDGGESRELYFSYGGLVLPGSMIEARWERWEQDLPRKPRRASHSAEVQG